MFCFLLFYLFVILFFNYFKLLRDKGVVEVKNYRQ